ncbi:MAG: adenylate/guanylate cyclase domain-containing protein [Chloroflexi bacterium]|nr:adenylate/guanylate cyclase domain-containing protein [Chloroflexota bacterium]
MSTWIRSLADRAGRLGADPKDSTEAMLQKRLTVALFTGTLPFTIAWSVIYLAAGAPLAAASPALYSLFTPLNTVIFAWTRNLGVYRFTQLLSTLILPFLVMLALGGFRPSSAVILWASLCPLGSLLLEELHKTLLWIAGFITLLCVGALLDPHLRAPQLSDDFITWFFVLNLGAVVAVAFALLYYFVGQRNFFQERSELLLLSILPREILETLKAGPRTIAEQFDEASILFADVVEFTPMAAEMTPLGLIDLLNDVFQCFDALVEKYDLEKIKTVGDCYMVAAGVPRRRGDHAEVLVRLALDMLDAVAERPFGGRRLAFRIGINSGPVVAGVIGRKKFIYDLWGESVNMASRMESHGLSGAIQIAEGTWRLVKDRFHCQERGIIDVKGVGPTRVWHVVSDGTAVGARRFSAGF